MSPRLSGSQAYAIKNMAVGSGAPKGGLEPPSLGAPMLAASLWLAIAQAQVPVLLRQPTSWEENLYYVGFFTAIIWSLQRPPVCAGAEGLFASALVYLLLPIADLAGGNDWSDGGTITVDVIMLLLAISLLALGRATARRVDGPGQSPR